MSSILQLSRVGGLEAPVVITETTEAAASTFHIRFPPSIQLIRAITQDERVPLPDPAILGLDAAIKAIAGKEKIVVAAFTAMDKWYREELTAASLDCVYSVCSSVTKPLAPSFLFSLSVFRALSCACGSSSSEDPSSSSQLPFTIMFVT